MRERERERYWTDLVDLFEKWKKKNGVEAKSNWNGRRWYDESVS